MASRLETIGELVEEIAYEIFCLCEAEKDYCIQHVGATAVVFGGTNRVIYSPRTGWRIDRTACTNNFVEHWQLIRHNYVRYVDDSAGV